MWAAFNCPVASSCKHGNDETSSSKIIILTSYLKRHKSDWIFSVISDLAKASVCIYDVMFIFPTKMKWLRHLSKL